MAIRLITGRSGQGKTTGMMKEICKRSMEHPEKMYFLIVPEQYSLSMQKSMVEQHEKHGFFNVDVLSFFRLAYRVFDECGVEPLTILEDLGVSMILKNIVDSHKTEFVYFRRSLDKPGFIDELKSSLMEFINYDVDCDDLDLIAKKTEDRPELCGKCRELSMIYRYFNAYIEGRFMVSTQLMDLLSDHVEESSLLKDAEFYLDGFTGFTPVQLRFLERLSGLASNLHISITIPEGEDSGEELFSFSEKTRKSLYLVAQKAGLALYETSYAQESGPQSKPEDLMHLEANILRVAPEVYPDQVEHIHLTGCRNPHAEAEYVAHKIMELVRKMGYRYREIAVVTSDPEIYESAFMRYAELLNIPVFEDHKKKASYHAGVESLRALFHIVDTDYSYESVFRYLKSGLTDIRDEDVETLENYVLESGVRGHGMYEKPFQRKLFDKTEDQIKRLNLIREQLMNETLVLYHTLKNREVSVREKLTVLYESLIAMNLPEKYEKKANAYNEAGNFVKEKEYRNLFSLLIELFEKIDSIFAEEKLSAEELGAIIDAGLSDLGIGVAPISADQLIYGDLKRTRLPHVKALFVMGANEGRLPLRQEDGGILNDEERKVIAGLGLSLKESLEEQSIEDDFYLYLMLSHPDRELYFTLSAVDENGAALEMSSFLESLLQIYPSLCVRDYPAQERRYYYNMQDSKELLIEGLADDRVAAGKAHRLLMELWYGNPLYQKSLARFWKMKNDPVRPVSVDPSLIEKLLGTELKGSASMLEMFSRCPYEYFNTYGMRYQERKEYSISYMDLGSIFHKTLERFFCEVKNRGCSYQNMDENVIENIITTVSEDTFGQVEYAELFSGSAREQYIRERIGRILKKTVNVLCDHLSKGNMIPDGFELKYGYGGETGAYEVNLGGGHSMKLRGSIDRVDIYEDPSNIYIRVVDYKSGNKEFKLSDIYNGISLQLVIYMNVAQQIYHAKTEKDVIPAGMYYYKIHDPILKRDEVMKEKAFKSFRMSGVTNRDYNILTLTEDRPIGEDYTSVNVKRNKKDGNPSKGSDTLVTDEFHLLEAYVDRKIQNIGEQIYRGEVGPYPLIGKENSACTYCRFRDLCGFDPRWKNYHHRVSYSGKNDVIINAIKREGGC